MNACILTIGEELLQGFTIDTNSSWLAKTLLPYGINITKKITLGDDVKSIVAETKIILGDNYDFLFVTGGLGPTHDDITKEAFRQLFNDELYLDKNYFEQLKEHFEKRIKKMPEINRSQAMLLKKADSIPNTTGSALGMHFFEQDTHIFIMPGVPGEMKGMIRDYIIPKYIGTKSEDNFITIKTAGVMESRLAENIQDLMDNYSKTFQFAFLPHYSGVSFRIKKLNEKGDIIKVKDDFFQAMQPYAYGIDDDSLEAALGKKLSENRLTIAVAESCTGGLIGKRLTSTPGSSDYFLGSITAYSNKLKTLLLGVAEETIEKYGVVSEEVAKEMGYKTTEKGRKAGYKQIKNLKKLFRQKAEKILSTKDIFLHTDGFNK